MRVYIKVIPKSSQNKLEKQADGSYKAWVRAVPEKGRANQALVELVAQEWQVAKNQVEVIAGKTSRTKLVEIRD